MKTKTINLYEFKELKKDIPDKVITKFQEKEDFYFLEDDLKNDIEEKLKELNYIIIEIKVFYNLSYSQGSGAMFEAILKKDD